MLATSSFYKKRIETTVRSLTMMIYKERLIKAFYHNQYELVKELLSSNDFDKMLMDDTGIFESASFTETTSVDGSTTISPAIMQPADTKYFCS